MCEAKMLVRSHNARMNTPQDAVELPGLTVVIGGTGGLGAALVDGLRARGETVLAVGRRTDPSIDFLHTESIAACAQRVADGLSTHGQRLQRLIVASGFLHGETVSGFRAEPERSWTHLEAQALTHSFAVNAIGPALVMRHFLPLLPRQGACLAAFLSARVGSIGDNALGGWYAYRAAKAALNQLVHTAAIELARRNREAVCVALHPGTVDTPLSQPFAKTGLRVRPAEVAAAELMAVMEGLSAAQTGGFFDHQGRLVPW